MERLPGHLYNSEQGFYRLTAHKEDTGHLFMYAVGDPGKIMKYHHYYYPLRY
jgi:hypothetical protein